ncbi:MAG: right-handed parallel beta-helix repeat-containing protein [Nitrososphaeraceae archaeon]
MTDRRISRRDVLKILAGGSAGLVLGVLGFWRLGNNPYALRSSETASSKAEYGVSGAKVTIIQDGSSYLSIRDDGSLVMSGTDPTTLINHGMENALSPGRKNKETIKLKGSFVNLRTILIPSYTILDLSDAYIRQADMTHDHLISNKNKDSGNTNIDIIGGIIDGNKLGNASDYEDLGFPGADVSNTIQLENVTNCGINSITMINGYYHGLRIRNSIGVLIGNCTFKSISRESITISGYAKPVGTCGVIRVSNNAIYDSGNSFVSTLKTYDVIISGNLCENVVGQASGITINGTNNQVVNNTIRNTYLDPISIAQINLPDFDASGSIVSGNICHGARFSLSNGISSVVYPCKNLIISNNRISGTGEGISLSGRDQNILITDNIINSSRNSGIRISGITGFEIQNIKISNNICYNNGTARDPNELNKAGIRLSSQQVGLLHDCVIENNSCFDDRQEGKTQEYGILLVNTKDCIVRQNYLRNNIVSGMGEVGSVGTVATENIDKFPPSG